MREYFETYYFSVVTMCTVGYGDVLPKNKSNLILINYKMRLFLVSWIYLLLQDLILMQ